MTDHYERGRLLFDRRRYEQAERELRQHLAACPDDPRGHALLGLSLLWQRRLPEAEREVLAGVAAAPGCPFAHFALACVLHEGRRLEEAEAAIAEAVRLDPQCPDYFDEWARVRLAQGQWGKAAETAQQGLAVDPQHVGCANALGTALTERGRCDEARSVLEAALARD